MKLAPIALFVYNRPWHTRQTVTALQNNELAAESELVVFSDGPKVEKNKEKTKNNEEKVKEVRDYIKSINGFKTVKIIERTQNLGLANSIISGVTEIVNQYGKIIVLEDDLVTSPHFLRFMNEALDLYEKEEDVISIHGYVYPIPDLPETFFLKGADCWGWATWKRGWDLFEPDGKKLLRELKEKKLLKRFDFNGTYPYTKMLKDQIKGKNDSWAIRWYASALLNGKLTLYPGKSLVKNIGLDSSGIHSGDCDLLKVCLSCSMPHLSLSDIREENIYAYREFIRFWKSMRVKILKKKLINKLLEKIRAIIPVPLKKFRRRYLCKYGFKGNFKTWEEALKKSTGYDNPEILEKVRLSTILLRDKIARVERDGLSFERSVEWPPINAILKEAEKKNNLIIVDYGGALGTLYFQHEEKLYKIKDLKWIVVEQPHFVECGKGEFSNGTLEFMKETDFFSSKMIPDVLILSSIIQYLKQPYEKILKIINLNIPLIIIDRTPFSKTGKEKLCIQKVNPKIYNASYPVWLLDFKKLMSFFEDKYELIQEFTPIDFDYSVDYKGIVLKLKEYN